MSSSSSSALSEDESIQKLLASIGCVDYDPLVIAAISEYSRRYASELLCDAKDFATHCGREEVDVSDLKLAIQLNDGKMG